MAVVRGDSGSGNKATFLVNVKFTQNGSWQGTVKWLERKETFRFRSALEFIRYVDSICAEGYEVSTVDAEGEEMIV